VICKDDFEQLTEKDVNKRHFVVCSRKLFGHTHRKNGEKPFKSTIRLAGPLPRFQCNFVIKQTRCIILELKSLVK